jgi:outer membrane protein assembly factor BamB
MRVTQRSFFPTAIALPVSVAAAGLCLWAWFTHDPAAGLRVRLPGLDGTPAASDAQRAVKDLSGVFKQFDGTQANLPGAWPRFRGPDFDNVCKNAPSLANAWNNGGPPILWKVDLGEGHAAPVVLGGRVYVLDYDEQKKADAIRCFSLADGREIWRRSYSVVVKRNHGMSRTVPAVTEKYLVTIGHR